MLSNWRDNQARLLLSGAGPNRERFLQRGHALPCCPLFIIYLPRVHGLIAVVNHLERLLLYPALQCMSPGRVYAALACARRFYSAAPDGSTGVAAATGRSAEHGAAQPKPTSHHVSSSPSPSNKHVLSSSQTTRFAHERRNEKMSTAEAAPRCTTPRLDGRRGRAAPRHAHNTSASICDPLSEEG